jgi:hypothetical protein
MALFTEPVDKGGKMGIYTRNLLDNKRPGEYNI